MNALTFLQTAGKHLSDFVRRELPKNSDYHSIPFDTVGNVEWK